jgi:hypothetical protein
VVVVVRAARMWCVRVHRGVEGGRRSVAAADGGTDEGDSSGRRARAQSGECRGSSNAGMTAAHALHGGLRAA